MSKPALSPREVAPRLESNTIGKPRKTQTHYAQVAMARGYTVSAGKETRSRLVRGIPKRDEWTPVTVEIEESDARQESL